MKLSIKKANKIAEYLETGKSYSFEEYQGYSIRLYFLDGNYFREYSDMMNFSEKPNSVEKFTKNEFLNILCGMQENWFRELLQNL